jgi:replicative DNA helicase
MLIDPDAMMEVEDFLRPDMFYSVAHQWLFEAMLGLYRRNEPLDTLTLIEELRRWNRLDGVGGEAEIIGLTNEVPTSLNAFYYAKIVEDCAIRREMLRAAERIAGLAWDEEQELAGQLDQAEQVVFDVRARQVERKTFQPRTYAIEFMAHLEELYALEGQEFGGLATGFRDLDRELNGLEKGIVTVVCGRPGMGKSALGAQIGWHVAQQANVFYWSGEMTTNQLVRRLVATETGLPSSELRKPGFVQSLDPDHWAKIHTAVDKVSKSGLVIDTTSSITPEQLRSACLRQASRSGLDLVVVDHLHLMAQQDRDETLSVSRNMASLRILAKDLGVAVVVLAQLSRGVESRQDKRPIMSDLRQAGKIEEDAEVIIGIYRDDYYNPDTSERPGVAELILLKHRNGGLKTVDMFFDGPMTTFKPLARMHDMQAGF